MGGSPKRGKAAGGCMSRGRLILLAVLTVQLLLVVGLMKAPRLVFSGSDQVVDDDETESASQGSWLWRKFVAENAKAQFSAKTPTTTTTVRKCKDGLSGRSVECENDRVIRKIDPTGPNVSGRSVRLPQESRLRRPGLITTRVIRDESGSSVLRQRRGRAESRLPARNGDRRVRSSAGDRLAAREDAGFESSQLRGSIGDSLERDSFRFRGGGGSYGDHLRGEVARDIAPAVRRHVSDPTDPSEDDPSEDEPSEDGFDDAIASYGGRRASSGLRFNATRRSNVTSLETSSEALLLGNSSTVELEDLEMNATATIPGALLGARNGTLSAQFGARNGSLGDHALSANVSAIIELFGAHNVSLGVDALTANVSAINATMIGELLVLALNASLDAHALAANVSGVQNATLSARFGAQNASLEDVDAVTGNVSGAQNATLGARFGAQNASLEDIDALTANVSGAQNATLGARFGAQNASLEGIDALRAANVSDVQNATLGARIGAQNASLEDVDALTANVSGVQNATLSELFGVQNVSLEDVDALAANVSGVQNATLGARFGAQNVSGVQNATLGALFGAQNVSLEDVDALAANVSGVQNATLGGRFGAQNVSLGVDALTANVSDVQNATCLRGLIYVYALPKRFNSELLENCSLGHLGNLKQPGASNHSGAGDACNGTDPEVNGEVMFHQHVLTHPCRTRIPELAKAFYIPYYGSLDVARSFSNATDNNVTDSDKDKLGEELVEWLARSPYWERHRGADHFLILDRMKENHTNWGSWSLNTTMTNVTKIAHLPASWDKLVKSKDAFDTTLDNVMANFDHDHLMNHTQHSVIKQALPGPSDEKSQASGNSRLMSETK